MLAGMSPFNRQVHQNDSADSCDSLCMGVTIMVHLKFYNINIKTIKFTIILVLGKFINRNFIDNIIFPVFSRKMKC